MDSDGHYISYVGDSSWINYVLNAKVKTVNSSTGWASLIFRILNDGTYYTFQIEPATTCAKLERRTDHSTTILRVATVSSLKSNTWYNLTVKIIDDSAYCYIDSALIFKYKGILIPSGGAGLASWHMNSEFDDFSVEAVSNDTVLSDKFNYNIDSGWIKPDGGNWKINCGVYTKDSVSNYYDGRYISYRGDSSWKDYTVSVDARSRDSADGWLSLIVRVQDSASYKNKYYTFQIDPYTNSGRFGFFSNNSFTAIYDRNDLCLSSNRWYNMSAKVKGDSVVCFLDDNRLFSIDNLNISSGGVGLASFHANADFDNFSIENINLSEISTQASKANNKKVELPSEISFSSHGAIYTLHSECHVSLKYFDLQGRCIASIVNAVQQAGLHTVTYKAHLPNGNYIMSFKAGSHETNKNIMISK
jgi:hypothetical protein